jgi:hypothetical protein
MFGGDPRVQSAIVVARTSIWTTNVAMNRRDIADLFAAAAGLLTALAAAVGLADGSLYRDAPFWAQQARGTDVATLFLAVPLLVIALVRARGGSILGRLAVVAVLLYLVYNYAIFAFTVAMNPLSAVYIAILGLAVWSIALGAPALDLAGMAGALEGRLPRRASATVLIGVGLLFALLWLSQIAAASATGVLPVDLVRAEIPTNPVYALDLGLFLPLCVASGIALVRGRPGALAAFAAPMLIWLSLTSAGIVGAFALQAQAGEAVPLPVAALVAVIGGVTAVLPAVAALRAGPPAKSAHRRGEP